MKKPNFISAYGDKLKSRISIEGESLTQQCFKEQCDINHMVKRAIKTGMMSGNVNNAEPMFGEFENIDFLDAQMVVIRANNAFNSQPAHIRNKFDNDPNKFIEFLQNDENYEEAVKLGLASKRQEEIEEVAAVVPKEDEAS